MEAINCHWRIRKCSTKLSSFLIIIFVHLFLAFANASWAFIMSPYYDPLFESGNTWTYRATEGGNTYNEIFTVLPDTQDIDGIQASILHVSKENSPSEYLRYFFSAGTDGLYYHGVLIHEHVDRIGFVDKSYAYSPPIKRYNAWATINDEIRNTGTATYTYVSGGTTTQELLTYTNTEVLLGFETMAVLGGTFNTLKSHTTFTLSGLVNAQATTRTTNVTNWFAPYISMVKSSTISYDGTRKDRELTQDNIAVVENILPDVKVNNSDGPVFVADGTPVSAAITLDAGSYSGTGADWWIISEKEGSFYSYVYPTGWTPGITPIYQGPLFDLPPFPIFNGTLPAGGYTIYFAVDANPDGLVNAPIWYDSVRMNVATDLVGTSALIPASSGGTLSLSDGASLSIPPGALAQDTMVTLTKPTAQTPASEVQTFFLSPEGLTLERPAELTIQFVPRSSEPGMTQISIYISSQLNPTVTVPGSESCNWQLGEVVARDDENHTITLRLSHFSTLVAAVHVDENAYIVMDIPGKYLKSGDLLFALTNLSPWADGPNWAPGHVGIYTGTRSRPPGNGNDGSSIIESTTSDEPGRGGVRRHALQRFKTDCGHLYMGARRASGGAISDSERDAMMSWLYAQLGKGYSYIGSGRISEGSFSCVGLAECMLDQIDRGTVTDSLSIATAPLEMFRRTVPVNSIIEDPGVRIEIPVYGVLVHPQSPYFGMTFRGWYTKSRNDISYSITASGLPEGATFAASGWGDYKFVWTPQARHAGSYFWITFHMEAEPVGQFDGSRIYLPVVSLNQRLVIHVRVPEPRPEIQAYPTEFSFEHVIGRTSCPQLIDTLHISIPGEGVLQWWITGSIPPWLQLSQTLGVVPADVDLSFVWCPPDPGNVQATFFINGRVPLTDLLATPVQITVNGTITREQVSCADFSGTYNVWATGIIDPAGHLPFTGNPTLNPWTFSITDSAINVTGLPPFVPVSGTVNQADCSFQASGSGVVAGRPNVSVRMQGSFRSSVSGTYTMGAGGELPGGQPIIFNFSGTRQ